MTTPVIKNLIGRARTENYAARAARTLEQFRAVLCKKKNNNNNNKNKKKQKQTTAKQQQNTTWNYHIEGYDDNLNLQLYMCAHTSLVLAYFANIVECKQVG